MVLSQLEDIWHQPSNDIWQLVFPYNNLMLFAWAGFVSAIWTVVSDANESHLNMSERKRDERAQHRKCVCVVIFGQNIKKRAIRQPVLFASYLTRTHIQHLYAPNPWAHTQYNHTNAANHSSIFYARMHKTLASLYKLQLMCVREKKRGEQAENTKVVEVWVGTEADEDDMKSEKYTRKHGQKGRRWEVRYWSFFRSYFYNPPGCTPFFLLCAIVLPFQYSSHFHVIYSHLPFPIFFC